MASRRKKAAQKLRGAQKWIMAEVSALRPSESLSTAQISKRIKKASGKDFHKNSVYLALRKLVDRGSLKAVRIGQEKTYKLPKSSDSGASASSSSASEPMMTLAATSTAPITAPSASGTDSGIEVASLPHKLAVGEILVLEITDGQVLTASNVHGKLVVERHPLA